MDSHAIIMKLAKYERQTHRDLLKDSKRPDLVAQLNADPVLMEKLREQMALAKRYTWPSTLELNL